MAEDDHINFDLEQQLSWIPAHVLQNCDDDDADHDHLEEESKTRKIQNNHRNEHKLPSAELATRPSKRSSKPLSHQRLKHNTSWGAAGGPGMQAIFLDSGHKSCGTGVFLPRTTGADFHLTNKQVCSPVFRPTRVVQALIPDRVVQALKLNVHELGLQIKQPADVSINSKKVRSNNNKKGSDLTSKTCVISQNHHRNSSQPAEIFLPKEWTY